MDTFSRDKTYAAMWEVQKKSSTAFTITFITVSLLHIICYHKPEGESIHLAMLSLTLPRESAIAVLSILTSSIGLRFSLLQILRHDLEQALITICLLQETQHIEFKECWRYPSLHFIFQQIRDSAFKKAKAVIAEIALHTIKGTENLLVDPTIPESERAEWLAEKESAALKKGHIANWYRYFPGIIFLMICIIYPTVGLSEIYSESFFNVAASLTGIITVLHIASLLVYLSRFGRHGKEQSLVFRRDDIVESRYYREINRPPYE